MKPTLSVIIPTLNEKDFLPHLLSQLEKWKFSIEIIVVDGGSKDGTTALDFPERVHLVKAPKGRAIQMNVGAKAASAHYFLFLHADSSLDDHAEKAVLQFMEERKAAANFRLQFDDSHWWLKLQCFFTKFTALPFQFGDQALLIQSKLFYEIGGFDQEMKLLEGQDIIRRIKRQTTFFKLSSTLSSSARKYLRYGRFCLQLHYYKIYLLYRMGVSQNRLEKELSKLVSETHQTQPSAKA
ncbi:MAG: TIGR04283 family arsenosugar biosynthesis glycosyltransferase [Vicingaceae bacterium]